MAQLDLQRIWKSSQLPTLPAVAVKLLELSKDPETGVSDVVQLIRTDPAITAKILKATNSSFFGLSSRVTSVERAVPLLGTNVVVSLALSFSLVDATMNKGPAAEFYQSYWLQSLVQAASAEKLSQHVGAGLDSEFFLAGLLMDIGRLALLKTIPDQYLPVLNVAHQEHRNLCDVERTHFNVDHAEIGGQMLRQWGLPEPLTVAVGRHHASVTALQQDSSDEDDRALQRVLAAAACMGDYFVASNKGLALERLRELTGTFYGLTADQLDELIANVKQRIQDAGDLFSVDVSQLGDPADLMSQASEQLATLAMRAQVATQQAIAGQQAMAQENRMLQSECVKLQQQALHDPLTRVYNRGFFDEALTKEVHRCCRYASPIGVVFIDVDHFKKLNDTYGHQFGDQVLKRVAAILGEVLRSADTLARYGGEEFVVLVNEPAEKGLQKLAERLRVRIESEPFQFGTEQVRVTASVGAAMGLPRRTESDIGLRLLTAADEAMYEAKHAGRNQVRVRLLVSPEDRQTLQDVNQRRFSRWLVARGAFDISTLSQVLLKSPTERVRLRDLAVRLQMLDASQVAAVIADQEISGQRFGEVAQRLQWLDYRQLVELLAHQLEDPKTLAGGMVRAGLCDVPTVQGLLQKYFAESPQAALVG